MVKGAIVVSGLILGAIHWRDQFSEHPATIRNVLHVLPFSLSVWIGICAVIIIFVIGEASYELVRKSRKETERLRAGFDQIQQAGKLSLLSVDVEKVKSGILSSGVQLAILTEVDQDHPLNDEWIEKLNPKTRAYCELFVLHRLYAEHRERLSWYAPSGFQSGVSKNARPTKLTTPELYEMLSEHEQILRNQAASLLAAFSDSDTMS